MDEPLFLTTDDVLQLHDDQLAHYGGLAGVRDLGLLESALAMPRQSFGGQYMHEDLPAMAAAYCYHIVRNHPFADGNKRTGLYAALVFLDQNGVEFTADSQVLGDVVLAVAAGQTSKDDLIAFFRQHAG